MWTYTSCQVVYFTNSGSEANDLAMFMARLYTGAFDVISLRYYLCQYVPSLRYHLCQYAPLW